MKSCRATICIALRRSALSFLLLLLLSLSASAQEDVLRPRIPSSLFKPITIGVEGGANFNLFSQTIDQIPVIPGSWLETYRSGTGFSPYAALMVDLPLTPVIALQVKGTYDAKKFGNTESVLYDCPNNPAITANVDHEYTVELDYIGVGAALRINATPEIFGTIGAILHSRRSHATYNHSLTITNPDECTGLFPATPTQTDTMYSSTRVGLEAGIGYKLAVTSTISLVPQLRFQYMLSKIRNDISAQEEISRQSTVSRSAFTMHDAMLHSIQLGLAVWYQL